MVVTAITSLTKDHQLHVYHLWRNSRTMHIYLFHVTRYPGGVDRNTRVKGKTMTKEHEDEPIDLSHLIVERLATQKQISRFNFLRKQMEVRKLLPCSVEDQFA